MKWTDTHQESADNPDIAKERLDSRPEPTIRGEVVPWYVPETHNRMKYEKKIGKPASLTVPRLRGRELAFPDGRLISCLVASEEDPSKLERLEIELGDVVHFDSSESENNNKLLKELNILPRGHPRSG